LPKKTQRKRGGKGRTPEKITKPQKKTTQTFVRGRGKKRGEHVATAKVVWGRKRSKKRKS